MMILHADITRKMAPRKVNHFDVICFVRCFVSSRQVYSSFTKVNFPAIFLFIFYLTVSDVTVIPLRLNKAGACNFARIKMKLRL